MTKFAGRGITVALEGDNLPQLREFGEVGSSRGLIDASAFGENWTDFVTGLQDGDEVNFVIAYDPAQTAHEDLVDIYENTDGRCVFTVEHDDAGFGVYVSTIVTALRRGGTIDGLLQMSGTVKIVNPGVVPIAS